MTEFAIALVLFLLAHAVPARPSVRRRLTGTLGERTYLALYSVVSIALLVWVIWAAVRAPYVALWSPAPWQYVVALAAMPLALVLLGAGLAQPNPLSISFSQRPFDPQRPGIVAITRHPLLWGFGLWALSHVPPNGDLVGLILFGGLAVFSFAGTRLVDRRKRRMSGSEPWAALAAGNSNVPFVALLAGRSRLPTDPQTWLGALAGLVVYALLLLGGHVWLFAVDPLAML